MIGRAKAAAGSLPQTLIPQTLIVSNVMDGGGRRSYTGVMPQYGDAVYSPWNGFSALGYRLQFMVSINWETAGVNHQLEMKIGAFNYFSAPTVVQINGAGDVGSGVTQVSPWTTVSQALNGTISVWDGIPGFSGDAHFALLQIWYRLIK